MPSEHNPREGFLKSYHSKIEKKKYNGKDRSVLTPFANNEGGSFCTGFVNVLILDLEFSNKSL
jgi:hypothetical protein